jgi:hypothetical protein
VGGDGGRERTTTLDVLQRLALLQPDLDLEVAPAAHAIVDLTRAERGGSRSICGLAALDFQSKFVDLVERVGVVRSIAIDLVEEFVFIQQTADIARDKYRGGGRSGS